MCLQDAAANSEAVILARLIPMGQDQLSRGAAEYLYRFAVVNETRGRLSK
jgi:hypothetical protein